MASVLDDDLWYDGGPSCLEAELADFDLWEAERLSRVPTPSSVVEPQAESVAQVLELVASLGPCGEAATLLESLADHVLNEDERLSVVQAWRPLLWWTTGQLCAATAAFAGPTPTLAS